MWKSATKLFIFPVSSASHFLYGQESRATIAFTKRESVGIADLITKLATATLEPKNVNIIWVPTVFVFLCAQKASQTFVPLAESFSLGPSTQEVLGAEP